MMRRMLTVLLTAGSMMAAVLTAASPASAGPSEAVPASVAPQPYLSCPGSPTGTPHSAFSGQVTVRVYYTSASGGTNCVWAVKNVSVGTPETQLMNVSFYRCNSNNPSSTTCLISDDDPGYWTSYAGPVGDTGMAGRCIMVRIQFRGAVQYQGPYHCG